MLSRCKPPDTCLLNSWASLDETVSSSKMRNVIISPISHSYSMNCLKGKPACVETDTTPKTGIMSEEPVCFTKVLYQIVRISPDSGVWTRKQSCSNPLCFASLALVLQLQEGKISNPRGQTAHPRPAREHPSSGAHFPSHGWESPWSSAGSPAEQTTGAYDHS